MSVVQRESLRHMCGIYRLSAPDCNYPISLFQNAAGAELKMSDKQNWNDLIAPSCELFGAMTAISLTALLPYTQHIHQSTVLPGL